MNETFTHEWSRQLWQLMVYLEAAYDYLEESDLVEVPERAASWFAQENPEGD
ncbi:MAG: hypothetical protein FJY73_08230 [Candidatus Eisenbacteria bacterium]|nr:hypothetical protein [Candidatus Eisenbacteria bacterium]